MNLFVAGQGAAPLDVERARQTLGDLLGELSFFEGAAVETWSDPSGRVAIAAAAHPEGTGGVRYWAFEPGRAALFAGRPVRWTGGGRADGTSVLGPSFYARPIEDWANELDGRCTALRAGDGSLEVFADPLGAYPLYETEAAGARWVSNSSELLRRVAGDTGIDHEALASVLGGGWSLGGQPVWSAVRRVPRGTITRLAAEAELERRELLPLERIVSFAGAGLDVRAAADTLVELTAALAGWPGRPDVVPVTGGRDSRVILAAAMRAGFAYEAGTGGGPSDPDVVIGARLCELARVPHQMLHGDPEGDRFTQLQRFARITLLGSGGTATLQDAAGYPLSSRPGPLPLWHSGQGGEIARAYYGVGGDGTADRLTARFLGRRPGRSEIVSPEAARMIAGRIGAFAGEMQERGAAAIDVPDLFYLLERMACWAAPSHGMVEFIRDTTSPLWSARMLPFLLGLPAKERELERFHHDVIAQLAPGLLDEPFQDGSHWPSRRGAAARRIERGLKLARKARAEARRRRLGRVARRQLASDAGVAADPFDGVLQTVQEAAHSRPQHPAWDVLDRSRVDRLLRSSAAELDEMSRMYVWRLASTFLGF